MSVQVVRVGLRNSAVAVPVGTPTATPGTPISVGARPSLGQLADVADTATAPTDVPLVLRKGADGVFRPEPAPAAGPSWGDQVRFAAGPPTDTAAPDDAVHVDLTTRRVYKHVRSST